MPMRQFTPRQPPADIRIRPQKYRPDPDLSHNHDDLYARAWECDYEQPICDAENNLATPPNSPEILLQSDVSTGQMRNTPGTAHKCPLQIFLKRKNNRYVSRHRTRCGDKLRTTKTVVRPTPAVPSATDLITRNLIARTTTDINSWAELMCSTEGSRRRSTNSRNASLSEYVASQKSPTYSGYSPATNSLATQCWLLQNTATKSKFDSVSFSYTGRFPFIY